MSASVHFYWGYIMFLLTQNTIENAFFFFLSFFFWHETLRRDLLYQTGIFLLVYPPGSSKAGYEHIPVSSETCPP